MRQALFLLICGLVASSAPLAQANQAEARRMAIHVCADCHRADGNSLASIIPRLAGQQPEYLLTQLKGFKDRTRSDPDAHQDMWVVAGRMDEETMQSLAAYFAAQVPFRGEPGDPKLVSQGQEIFKNGLPYKNLPACATCHGAQGEGAGTFPRIARQHAVYIVNQMKVFHTDQRPAGVVMQGVARALTDQEAEAVAAYLQEQ